MATNFPTSKDSYTTLVDGTDYPKAAYLNDRGDAIEALETKVGIDGSTVTTSHDYKISTLETHNTNIKYAIDYSSFATAVSDIGSTVSTTLIVSSPQTLTADVTVTSNIYTKALEGTLFTGEYTITFNGPFDAELYEVFDTSSTITVKFGDGAVTEVYPEWWGVVGDGTTDDSNAFKSAIAAGNTIYVHCPSAKYKLGQITIPSNFHMFIEPGTIIEANDSIGDTDVFFVIDGVSNVLIEGYGVIIQGLGASNYSGSQAHIFQITNSTNVAIKGIAANASGGDGFNIGLRADYSKNVYLIDTSADANRRNGYSITAGKNIWVVNFRTTNNGLVSPYKGVDVEPDDTSGDGVVAGVLENIHLISGYSNNNAGPGFSYAGGHFTNANNPVSVYFADCLSNSDSVGMRIEASAGQEGIVYIKNFTSLKSATNGFDLSSSGIRVELDGLFVNDANQSASTDYRYASGLSIYSVDSTDGTTYGNIRGRNITIMDGDSNILSTIVMQLVGEASSKIEDVDLKVWTDMADNQRVYQGGITTSNSINRKVTFIDGSEYAATANIGTSSTPQFAYGYITNKGATADVTVSLDDSNSYAPGTIFKFRVEAAYYLILDTAASGIHIFPGDYTSLKSNSIGDEVWIRSTGSKWLVIYENGSWVGA